MQLLAAASRLGERACASSLCPAGSLSSNLRCAGGRASHSPAHGRAILDDLLVKLEELLAIHEDLARGCRRPEPTLHPPLPSTAAATLPVAVGVPHEPWSLALRDEGQSCHGAVVGEGGGLAYPHGGLPKPSSDSPHELHLTPGQGPSHRSSLRQGVDQ
eukprot:1795910-Heterocapsa_arctica.AAC.1